MDVAYWFLLAPYTALESYLDLAWVQTLMPWTAIFRVWQAGHEIFAEMKSDSFFLCSPSGSMLMTCDTHLVKEVLSRSQDFHAPIEVLSLYNLYGPTLAASEGEAWRRYRKISTPFFNSKTHEMVWKESLEQAELVSAQWSSIRTVVSDVKGQVMSKLNLRVIAKVFYGQDLGHQQNDAVKDEAPPGHQLAFSEAINAVLSNLATLFGIPRWILGGLMVTLIQQKRLLIVYQAKSPFKSHRMAFLAYFEWHQYMQEMRSSVHTQLETIKQKDDPCFLESLVISSITASQQEGYRPLTEAEILGNMFFYVMAGFDTTSTTLSFIFLLLALHTDSQLLLQRQLDEVLGTRSPAEWSADYDVQHLLSGYLGAVISETLRIYHPVAWYARRTVRETTVTDSRGISHVLPVDTTIIIDLAAIGRHPLSWPSERNADATEQSRGKSPALDFDPSRWTKMDSKAASPFSSGHRMCPGKRFAEVEMCAMIARFFIQFSLRLVPDPRDVAQAKSAGYDKLRLREMTRERAANAMFKHLEFGHGIYPQFHTAFEVVPRGQEDRIKVS